MAMKPEAGVATPKGIGKPWKRCLVGTYTVEPPKKGHFGSRSFVLCSEVVPISEVPTEF